jgi:NADH:ubiquinone oxidoreductase subunit 3 (subunit A)
MTSNWLFIGIFTAIAMFLPGIAIFIASLLAPRKPNKIKLQTYECGLETVGPAWIQVKAQYYVFTLAFLVFDVEAVFLFPWAVAYNQLTLFGVIEAVIFILILLGGLFYIWRKGQLEWA